MTQAASSSSEVSPRSPGYRILTGDTPTGQLHLGHYVGSVRRRVELQSQCECYFIIANIHAFTTRSDKPAEIRSDSLEIVRDYLAMGIDPSRGAVFLQSEVPAIAELTYLFAMILPFNRVMRNPTLKDEIKVKGLGDTYSFGFPLYAVGQTADILAFRAHGVPVGEDQVPHIELTREVARRFNQMYCGVSDQAEDDDHEKLGGVFPVPRADVGRVGRLVGTDGKEKMSKSLNNAIFITDTAKQIKKKLGKLYTGRQSANDPGDTENALVSTVAALSTFYPESVFVNEPHLRREQIVRLIGQVPTLAAFAHRKRNGLPFVYPDRALSYMGNFLSMMFRMTELRYEPDPIAERVLEVLFILHADHEQSCSTTTMRCVGSARTDPYSATAAAAAALYGRFHDEAYEAVLDMLEGIGGPERVTQYVHWARDAGVEPPGFGHHVYRTYDPRARILRDLATKVVEAPRRLPVVRDGVGLGGGCGYGRVLPRARLLSNSGFLRGDRLSGARFSDRDVSGAVRDSAIRRMGGAVGRNDARSRAGYVSAAADLRGSAGASVCFDGRPRLIWSGHEQG